MATIVETLLLAKPEKKQEGTIHSALRQAFASVAESQRPSMLAAK